MLVAMPTAIPLAPLTRRFGSSEGITTGSRTPGTFAKFGPKSTVSFSMSSTRLMATEVMRASVYRYAAGGSPSTEPKLPCPSMSG